ncbi:MAG: Rrf2 family transcriptional regulator [Alphaproteobacteria bacterium]|nr:Rrf2 family transcriptional regulator [Alphaproteobacteria bacterium]
MMLTTKARYAVMALVDIALNCEFGPVSLAEVAQRQNIDLRYLEQIFVKLKNINILKATRGRSGGYLLNQSAKDIKISKIIESVEEGVKMTRCNSKSEGCVKNGAKCLTHDLWYSLEKVIQSFLDRVTIEDVLIGRA